MGILCVKTSGFDSLIVMIFDNNSKALSSNLYLQFVNTQVTMG
jgi:hypothetical protein